MAAKGFVNNKLKLLILFSSHSNTPQQNLVEEQLEQQIDRLTLLSRLLAFRACNSDEKARNVELALAKSQQAKVLIKNQSHEVVKEMEQVVLAIISSLKSFQAESRANLFGLQTQLQNSEKQLQDATKTIKQLTEKVETLESTLSENKRLFEVSLQAFHINYVNLMEGIFEKLQETMVKDLTLMEDVNDKMQEAFTEQFKKLGLQCTFDKI